MPPPPPPSLTPRHCPRTHPSTLPAALEMDNYGDSVVFSDDWFGEFNPQNELNTVERGRFAYLPIQQVRVFLLIWCSLTNDRRHVGSVQS